MNGVANGLYGGDLPNQINTPWIDFSEQSTIVGWSSFTVRRMLYKRIGDILFLNVAINGTSNSTSATFTLPFVFRTNATIPMSYITNNGVNAMGGFAQVSANTNNIILWRPILTSSWTASGTKEISFTGIVNL
jgi:hypothetical protein